MLTAVLACNFFLNVHYCARLQCLILSLFNTSWWDYFYCKATTQWFTEWHALDLNPKQSDYQMWSHSDFASQWLPGHRHSPRWIRIPFSSRSTSPSPAQADLPADEQPHCSAHCRTQAPSPDIRFSESGQGARCGNVRWKRSSQRTLLAPPQPRAPWSPPQIATCSAPARPPAWSPSQTGWSSAVRPGQRSKLLPRDLAHVWWTSQFLNGFPYKQAPLSAHWFGFGKVGWF